MEANYNQDDATLPTTSGGNNGVSALFDPSITQGHLADGAVPQDTAQQDETKQTDSARSTAASSVQERQLQEERVEVTREAGSRLEGVLNDIKKTTKHLLAEINVYMETVDGVTLDYLQVQENEHQEAQRLQDVAPDVQGLTSVALFHQAQQQSRE